MMGCAMLEDDSGTGGSIRVLEVAGLDEDEGTCNIFAGIHTLEKWPTCIPQLISSVPKATSPTSIANQLKQYPKIAKIII